MVVGSNFLACETATANIRLSRLTSGCSTAEADAGSRSKLAATGCAALAFLHGLAAGFCGAAGRGICMILCAFFARASLAELELFRRLGAFEIGSFAA